MKTIKHLVFLLLSVFLLSACSSDDELMPTDGDRTPVSFTAHVSRLKTTDGGDQWAAGDQLGIFMKQAGEDLSSAIENNRKYQTDAEGNFTLADGGQIIYWPQDETTVDFVAYYPYQASFSTPYIYEVDVSDQSDPAKIDLLYSNDATNKSKSKEAVALSFDHMLSKLSFSVKAGAGVTSLEDLSIEIQGVASEATLDLSDGTITATNSNQKFAPCEVTATKQYEAILIPQQAATGSKIAFKIGSETFNWDIGGIDFEQGKQHNYTVTVNHNNEVIAKAEGITDWKPTNAFYQIGDPYPDVENPIGIVFETSNGGRDGKIVSLDETQLKWSQGQTITEATDALNGMANMHTITQISDWENKYPAFAWVHGKNDATTDYSDPDAKGIWYLPAIDELTSLFLVYNRDREGFNASLTTAGGALLSEVRYWSSLEDYNYLAWGITFDFGERSTYFKEYHYMVRCVSAF